MALDRVEAVADRAEQRIVGWQPGVGRRGDNEELAARSAGRLGLGLRHRHGAADVGEVRGRRLVDEVAGAAGAVAARVAALNHEAAAGSGGSACRRRGPARRGRRTTRPSSGRAVSSSIVKLPQLVSTTALAGPDSSLLRASESPCFGRRGLDLGAALREGRKLRPIVVVVPPHPASEARPRARRRGSVFPGEPRRQG